TAAAFGVKGAGGPWVAGTTTWSTDATQLTFRPGGSLAVGTQYEVHVNATSSDASDPGNAIGHDSIWTFSTGALTDRTPPQIRSLSANPSAQIANGFVNVTADVDDTGGIATVTAAIQGPGVNQNLSLTHASGARWYLNRAYSAVGHYNITLWATDMSGNVASNETGIDIVPNGAGGIPAPQSVTVSLNDGLVDVTWSPVAWPNLAGHYVYRGNRSTAPFERLASIAHLAWLTAIGTTLPWFTSGISAQVYTATLTTATIATLILASLAANKLALLDARARAVAAREAGDPGNPTRFSVEPSRSVVLAPSRPPRAEGLDSIISELERFAERPLVQVRNQASDPSGMGTSRGGGLPGLPLGRYKMSPGTR